MIRVVCYSCESVKDRQRNERFTQTRSLQNRNFQFQFSVKLAGQSNMQQSKLMDPWLSQNDKLVESTRPEEESVVDNLEDTSAGRKEQSIPVSFSDNFQPFQKLPDSFQYLASLETKLENIQNSGKKTSRSLLRSLEETRESYMVNLLTDSVANGISLEEDSFEELKVNPVLKKLVPQTQALTTEELVHLVKADQLDILLNTDTEEDSVVTEAADTAPLNSAEPTRDENISNCFVEKESPQ